MGKSKMRHDSAMSLTSWLAPWFSEDQIPAGTVRSCTMNTQTIQPGDVFLACRGGSRYLRQACEQGASLVLCDDSVAVQQQSDPRVLYFPDLSQHLMTLLHRLNGDPSLSLELLGITGTNGKSSCSQYWAQALDYLGQRCGIVGTLGHGFFNQLQEGHLTTPDPVSLQAQLHELAQQNAKAVAMEVSSHALDQHRVTGLSFKIALFTHLTRDHLDYHGTMEAYAAAKKKLFQMPSLEAMVLNVDDAYGRQWSEEFENQAVSLWVYAQHTRPRVAVSGYVYVTKVQPSSSGMKLSLETSQGNTECTIALMGQFNAMNVAGVVAGLMAQGYTLPEIKKAIEVLRPVPGRMQTVSRQVDQPWVVVDYAHTPDALEQALKALREHVSGRVWVVFGCGGDRDIGKRPLMGAVAEQYADEIILTNDNPRSELPERIVDAILSGIQHAKPRVILDRREAIAAAVSGAEPGDGILVAGKGHERYQKIGTTTLEFDDAAEVKQALLSRWAVDHYLEDN